MQKCFRRTVRCIDKICTYHPGPVRIQATISVVLRLIANQVVVVHISKLTAYRSSVHRTSVADVGNNWGQREIIGVK